MSLQVWLLYTVAALGLSLSPGPNSLLALTHGALYGVRAALATLIGGSLGFVFIIALSMFGIDALIKASPEALSVLQWVGAAYLAWLGVQVWRAPALQLELGKAGHPELAKASQPISRAALFRQGLLAAATNPKGILFFAAFLPQFVSPEHEVMLQFVIMAATFVIIEFFVELALAGTAQRVAGWLVRMGRSFNRVCGGVFVALALAMLWRG
jgi:threonine/homoserine/homoserine lactone efflux protein